MLAVDPGEVVTFELRDSRDGTHHARRRRTRTCSRSPSLAHPLTGPLEVRGAEPGRRARDRGARLRDRRLRLDRDLAGLGLPRRPLRPPLPRALGARRRAGALGGRARRGRARRRVRRRDRAWPLGGALRARARARGRPGGTRRRLRPAEPRAGGAALGRRRPAHLPAARERRQHRHPRPRGGQPPAAARARARRAAVDRRPALRPGRRRGLHLRDRDRRGRDRARGPAPRRLAPPLPGLGEPAAAGTQPTSPPPASRSTTTAATSSSTSTWPPGARCSRCSTGSSTSTGWSASRPTC